MDAYHALAASYDRLTNDIDYEAAVEFYMEILRREDLHPRTVVDLACGTGSVTEILARKESARKAYLAAGADLVIDSIRDLPAAIDELKARIQSKEA